MIVFLKGVAMGAADTVPGVSGGTIALITGIYERLISAITAVTLARLRRILAALVPGRRADAVAAVREVDGLFLGALGAGILTAVLVMTRLLAFLSAGQAGTVLPSTPLVTVGVGAVAISAMVLPGISGSLILVILGQYEFLVARLTAFVDGLVGLLVGETPVGALFDPAGTVVAFVAGALVGLFTVAHAVRWALEQYRYATLAFLVSLVVGGLRAPVVQAGTALAPTGWTTAATVGFAFAAAVGAAIVVGLERYTEGIVV